MQCNPEELQHRNCVILAGQGCERVYLKKTSTQPTGARCYNWTDEKKIWKYKAKENKLKRETSGNDITKTEQQCSNETEPGIQNKITQESNSQNNPP